MKSGFLSSYFEGIAVKRLSAVEAHPEKSNQHEFNGVAGLKSIFGLPVSKKKFEAQFIYLSDDVGDYSAVSGFVTWYDARERHPTRTEYRLYFSTTDVSQKICEGDLLVIAKRSDNSVFVIIAQQGTTEENQIIWLFGLQKNISSTFTVKEIVQDSDIKLGFASRFILDELGIQVDNGDYYLETMLEKFKGGFPSTFVFSDFARKTIEGMSCFDEPDSAITTFMEQEEKLFRTLERHFVSHRLREGFGDNGDDVDDFIGFSLSVQNRRKARVGHALENHLEHVFKQHEIRYSRGKITENRTKPDFIFPDIKNYHRQDFDAALLTMLGAKSTCKDRWRQVLTEANRIKNKHLFTLEPAISIHQTDEMQANCLQLVVPESIIRTYDEKQQGWLLNLKDFISLVKTKQEKSSFFL